MEAKNTEEKSGPADYLRDLANSEEVFTAEPSLQQMRAKLQPLYPWIFDPQTPHAAIEDHYDLGDEAVIGQGLVGTIKTAINKSTGMKVACKFFKRQPPGTLPTGPRGPTWSKEAVFLRELFVLNSLPEGPGFPRILGAYLTEADMVIVMTLHGRTLESVVMGAGLQYPQVKAYAKEMFSLMYQLGKKGIWHCDPRLSNLLLPREDEEATNLTLIDFGFNISSTTPVELVVHPWTITLFPPEAHFNDYIIPEKSMVWTLGDNVYRMMTKQLPFIDPTPRTKEEQKEIFAKEYQINPDWPEEVIVFLKAVLVEEATRPSAEQLQSFAFLQ
jgi:serine/threonine protein kinase